MKTIFRFVVVSMALVTGFGNRLTAQEGGAPRSAGHVLLLNSDRGLEGDIEKFGEQYRIRRGTSEVWLPMDKALRLCADWEDAYSYMKTRANLGDPEERLRLARWCQLNNLPKQALIEAKMALEMRPAHVESHQLVTILTRAVASLNTATCTNQTTPPAKFSMAAVSSDISADSFALFATRVQPILMNTCISCHSGGRGGDFQLVRTEGGQRASSQTNLASVMAQIKMDNPALSPLLIKAVSRHGNAANAPIKDRQTIPFKTLQAWIDYLIANNPHLKMIEAEPVAEAPKKNPEPVVFAHGTTTAPLRSKPQVVSQTKPRTESSKEAPGSLPPLPDATRLTPAPTEELTEPQVNAQDLFDPALFNRPAQPRK